MRKETAGAGKNRGGKKSDGLAELLGITAKLADKWGKKKKKSLAIYEII